MKSLSNEGATSNLAASAVMAIPMKPHIVTDEPLGVIVERRLESPYNLHMRYARVGDAVWYTIGALHEKAEILALVGTTQAVVLLLTGPKRGDTPDAPRGTIEPVVIREICREYEIEVRVRVDKGLFTDRGFIRKSNPAGTGLPFETSFESGERHASAEEALQAGAAFARRKIDGM